MVRRTRQRRPKLPGKHNLVPDGLEEGHLVFSNRFCLAQAIDNAAGDPWTHVGVLARVQGDLRVVELVPGGCSSRAIADFFAAYRVVGVGRTTLHQRCSVEVARWASASIGSDLEYAMPRIVFIVSAMLARRAAVDSRCAVSKAFRAASAALEASGDPNKLICSSFIVRALNQACEHCRPQLVWPTREPSPLFTRRPRLELLSPTDSKTEAAPFAVEALTTPSDLWVAPIFKSRLLIEGHRMVEMKDRHSQKSLGQQPAVEVIDRKMLTPFKQKGGPRMTKAPAPAPAP